MAPGWIGWLSRLPVKSWFEESCLFPIMLKTTCQPAQLSEKATLPNSVFQVSSSTKLGTAGLKQFQMKLQCLFAASLCLCICMYLYVFVSLCMYLEHPLLSLYLSVCLCVFVFCTRVHGPANGSPIVVFVFVFCLCVFVFVFV